MDEQELMKKIEEGDEMAFTQIVTLYKSRIVNFLYQLTSDYEKAVELAQETFMRVYFKAKRYRPIAPVSSWIYTIASNLAKTEMKKKQRMTTVSIDDEYSRASSQIYYEDNPEDMETIKNLRKALNSLHSRYRIPLVLKDIEGFSQEEIAEMLNKPIGTIKARISRGRAYLKKEIEKNPENFNILSNGEEYGDERA